MISGTPIILKKLQEYQVCQVFQGYQRDQGYQGPQGHQGDQGKPIISMIPGLSGILLKFSELQ